MTLTRRHILKGFCGLGVASQVNVNASPANQPYKALVCIDLKGGNDGFQTFIPQDPTHYELYQSIRGHLTIPKADLVPLTHQLLDWQQQSVSLACHPALTPLKKWLEQSGTIIANCGILSEPLFKEKLLNNQQQLPPLLFSHNSQSTEWYKAGVTHTLAEGWMGRVMEALTDKSETSSIASQFSLSGNAHILRTRELGQNIFKGKKITTLRAANKIRHQIDLLTQTKNNEPFHHSVQSLLTQALYTGESLKDHLNNVPDHQAFTTSNFSQQLHAVYKLIQSQSMLQHNRQVFYVRLGGFDTHDDQSTRQPKLLNTLSEGLSQFFTALNDTQRFDQVTTFTISDFGRRIPPNDTGTDHGWGNNHFIVGGAINANKTHGVWPDLKVNGQSDWSKGRMIPTTAFDQVAASMAQWMGVTDPNVLQSIFPNLHQFENSTLPLFS